MIFVDNRAGSQELITPLRKLGVSVESTRLDYGDLMFEGRGAKKSTVSIGIEYKKISDLVASIRSGRLQGFQMKGMRDLYDHSYLFIEGDLRYDSSGSLQRRKGKPLAGQMTVSELLKRIEVLHLCGGLNPRWTTTRSDTLQAILALYHTWTDVDLDAHKSHLAIYEAPALSLVEPSAAAKTAHVVAGIGWGKAKKAGFKFKTPKGVCAASVTDWMSIDGIGKALAQRAVQILQSKGK